MVLTDIWNYIAVLYPDTSVHCQLGDMTGIIRVEIWYSVSNCKENVIYCKSGIVYGQKILHFLTVKFLRPIIYLRLHTKVIKKNQKSPTVS